MTSLQKIALALISILMPVSVMAAGAPQNVRGVQVNTANGAITVTWKPVSNNVAFYRVYYSHESILKNQGNYDDFERTRGLETAYTFTKAPLTSGKLFVSVLAVSSDGTESEGFEEEASLELGSTVTTTTQASPTPQVAQAPVATPLTIASIGPVSGTGILVTFSENVTLNDATKASDYFVVMDTGGTLLGLTRITVVDAAVLIHTEMQTPGKTYILSFAKPIVGVSGGSLPVDTAPAKFLGCTAPVAVIEPKVEEPAPVAAVPAPTNAPVYIPNPYVPVQVPAPVATVVTTKSKDTLPGSGVPLIGIAIVAGAGAVGRRLRRKKA